VRSASRSCCTTRGGRVERVPTTASASRSSKSCWTAERFLLVTHENPDGDALGSLDRHARRAGRARQGRRDVPARAELPLPSSTASCAGRSGHRAARRPRRAHHRLPGLRQPRAQPDRGLGVAGRPRAQHRPPPRQHALRHGQPRRRPGVVHGGDRLDLMGRLGVRATGDVADALYVGLVTTPAGSCTTTRRAARSDGRRPHRGRRRLHGIYRYLYEGMPYAKLLLLGRSADERCSASTTAA